MTNPSTVRERAQVGEWTKQGTIGGILAGIVFAAFEMVMAVVMMGPDAFFMPLRMIGGIALGANALEPTTPLVAAGGMGVVVHMILSAVFGAVFGAAAAVIPAIRASTARLLIAGTTYGIAVWLVNFYLIAPAAGWNWFPEGTNPVVQVVAHGPLYGTLVAAYLAFRSPRVSPQPTI